MHLAVSDHMIVEQDKNMGFSIVEEKNEHESFAIKSNLRTLEDFTVMLDLVKPNMDVASVRQHVKEKQSTQKQAIKPAVNTLTHEERRKCSQMDIKIEFVKVCHVELHEYSRGKAMYRRHSNELLKRNQPSEELQQVTRLLLRKSQMQSFGQSYQALAAGKPMAASDHLNKLSPFMDDQNLMRLKGRLRHADASYEMKHPILLSAKHPIVRKLIEDAHENNYHEGAEYVRSILQQNYWIIGLRNALRNVKLKCVKCRKQQVGVVQPFMADLPKERLEERVVPFANTGVDYFGPFEVRFMRKSMKRWCCLFTCLTTRAVYVEVVPSLEADACLAAITRFIPRRGKPNIILSDNGTNFVGAAREMREWIEAWNQSDIEQSLAQKQIKWKFNPPGAPHLGGVWERMVRSCRKAKMAIVGNRTLTDDVLSTTMCLVEQILNSRPLTSASDDPEDLEALTPNHILLGRASPATPFIPDAQR